MNQDLQTRLQQRDALHEQEAIRYLRSAAEGDRRLAAVARKLAEAVLAGAGDGRLVELAREVLGPEGGR